MNGASHGIAGSTLHPAERERRRLKSVLMMEAKANPSGRVVGYDGWSLQCMGAGTYEIYSP